MRDDRSQDAAWRIAAPDLDATQAAESAADPGRQPDGVTTAGPPVRAETGGPHDPEYRFYSAAPYMAGYAAGQAAERERWVQVFVHPDASHVQPGDEAQLTAIRDEWVRRGAAALEREHRYLLACVLEQAGGEMRVPDSADVRLKDREVLTWYEPQWGERVFTLRARAGEGT